MSFVCLFCLGFRKLGSEMTGVLDITGKAYESGNKVVEAADIVGPEDDLELQKAKQSLTGRGVLLRDLIVDGIIEPGENVLSIDYRVSVIFPSFD